MSHGAPVFVEAVHLVPVERVAYVGGPARLTLVHAEIEPPRLHDGLEAEQIRLRGEKAIKTALLVFAESIKLTHMIILGIDLHVHLLKTIVTPGGVLIVVQLVFAHIPTSHATVLGNHSLLELLEQSIVCHFESLN